MKKGICKLCLQEKELQRKSHVIPEFFYRESELFHENHNLVKLNLRSFFEKGKIEVVSSKQKTGEYDEYVLCKSCDGQVINVFETYGREFLYGENLSEDKRLIIKDFPEYVECKNADYSKIKLLFLSILWRADLSKREVFKSINLGSERDEIRQMILENNPKSDIEYPVFFMTMLADKTITKDNLFTPIKIKFGEEDGFLFSFSGYVIVFTNGIKGIKENLLKFRIQENGMFRVLKIPHGKSWEFLKNLYV